MADNTQDNTENKNVRATSKGPVNNDGPGEPRIVTPITAPSKEQSPENEREEILRERMARYAKLVSDQKQKMMEVDKEKLVDVIFRQNSLITQQSNQMIDLVNLVNELDATGSDRSIDSQASVGVPEDLQKNIDILRKRNELCQAADQMRQDSARVYSSSVRIQFVLFTLFILVLLWLLYHYMY